MFVPVYYDTPQPGAFGSLWTTLYRLAYLDSNMELRPGDTETSLGEFQTSVTTRGAGRQLYIDRGIEGGAAGAERLEFQLRAVDVSQHANAGTEVPVVRQNEYRTATTNLLNIPVDPANFRLTLRLYELNRNAADFIVRVYDSATAALLIEAPVHLETPPQGRLLIFPPYLQSDVWSLSGATPPPQLPANIRVQIEPRTAGSAFRAVVSITNNHTQMLTLVTPQ